MPKPKKVEPKAVPKAVPKASARAAPTAAPLMPAEDRFDDALDGVPDVPSRAVDHIASVHPTQHSYPPFIRELLSICVGEASDVRAAFKNRNRQKYKNIFDNYKEKLSAQDYSIVKGALFYLYDFSRVNSIDKDTAMWMIGIYQIPTSQIVSYTSKEVLKGIARDHGLAFSNKKAEELVENIRGVIDPSQ
jgi:hypothetical protein